ncbi:rim15, signal transduction response regulator [Coemansia sp. RSA 2610]|nr:rim15, signal transduction response regulator [Coemansia sp. RSA 2610]
MGSTAPKHPRGRSRQKRRRFGFLNLFGFSGDAYEAEDADSTSLDNSRSHSERSRSTSRSRNSSDSSGSGSGKDHGIGDGTAQPPGAPSGPINAATPKGPAAAANKHDDVSAVIPSSSGAAGERIPVSSSASAISQPISFGLQVGSQRQQPGASALDAHGRSGSDNAAPARSVPGHFAAISPAHRIEPSDSGSQIRTCPIPERLRLQLRDPVPGQSDTNSPASASYSVSTVADSPRMIPEIRPRRRGTIGAFGSAVADTRHTHASDKHPSRLAAGEYSPRVEKIPIPLARRTSSNNSAWSTVTPTSAMSTADSVSATAMSQADSSVLPDWEQVGQQPPSKSRARSRRYSVFDLSFANQQQQQQRSTGNAHPSHGLAQAPVSPTSRRRGSSKSTLDVSTAESSSTPGSLRRLSGAEPGPIFGGSSSNIRRRTSSRVQASSPTVDSRGLYSHAQMSPTLAYAGFGEYPASPQSRYHKSQSSVTTFSTHSHLADDAQHESDMQTPASEHSASRRRRNQRASVFPATGHESSSGHSTPTNLLFSRIQRNRSASAKSINVAEANRGLEPPTSARSYQPGDGSLPLRRRRCGYACTECDEPDDTNLDTADLGGEAEIQDLKFTTSTPDILFIPTVYNCASQAHIVRRPDYSYERLLAMSRRAKARRWRHRHLRTGNNADGAADHRAAGTGRAQRQSSAVYAHDFASQHQNVAASTSNNLSRQNSTQQPNIDVAARPPRHQGFGCGSCFIASNPGDEIAWSDWIDSVKDESRTGVVQRVVEMWQSILCSWKRNRRRRSGLQRLRRDSSASVIGVHKTSDTARGQTARGLLDGGSTLSSGGTLEMLNTYTAEPVYLQRGVSESGRHSSPSNAFSLMHQLTGYGAMDTLLSSPEYSSKALAGSEQSPTNAGQHSSTGGHGGLALPPSPKQPALQRVADSTLPVGSAAPHRRLSIVKDHELGRPQTNRVSSTSSRAADKSDDGASSASSNASLVHPEKSPWIIAQFGGIDEAVNVLSAFQMRLQQRLSKAKSESEEELLDIIQSLSSFVEEGLSYVHEDMDQFEPANADSVASDGFFSDVSYATDDDGVETPGLMMSRKALPVEHRRATQALRTTASSTSMQPTQWANEAASTQLELKSLNRRLHDVLNRHAGIDDTRDGTVGHALQQMELPVARSAEAVHFSVQRNDRRPSSPMRLPRTPSIRRLAFLRAISGESGDSAPVHPPSPLRAADYPDQPAKAQPCDHSDSQRKVPCIVCTPSETELAPTASRPRTWHTAPSESNEYFGGWETRQVAHSSPPSHVPFPSLHKRRSTQSICSGRSGLSSRAGSRHSLAERSGSRISLYSSDSASSLLTTPLVTEDEFKPTPFLAAIMDLVNIIGHVLSLSPEDMLRPLSGSTLLGEALAYVGDSDEERGHVATLMPTEYLVQRLNDLGYQWEQSQAGNNLDSELADQAWPCRGLFFRALLAISSLNRIVMWYAAVRAAYSDEVLAELDRRTETREMATAGEPALVGSPETSQELDIATPRSFLRKVSSQSSAPEGMVQSGSLAPADLHGTRSRSQSIADQEVVQDMSQPWHNYRIDNPPHWREPRGSADSATTLDKGLNMLVEISLDGRIRYISPTSQRLLGADADSMIDQPATALFDTRDVELCRSAVEQLLADSTQTVELNVRVHPPDASQVINVEAKGMLIYSRLTNEPSHVLWVLRYLSLELPGQHLPTTDLSAVPCTGVVDETEEGEVLVPPSLMEPITCRICDRSIPATYFEEHSWLCAKSHRAAMDVERQNDRLGDIKVQIQAWYPGCSFEDLDDMLHGELDAEVMRERAQERANAVGSSTWQVLIDESGPVVKSMTRICARAMALDRSDSAPQCEWRPALDNASSQTGAIGSDFARSDAWIEVADYALPTLEYSDPSLQLLGAHLLQTISDKLAAVDSLQYAIVDSALACTKWMSAEDSILIPEAAGCLRTRPAARSTSDLLSIHKTSPLWRRNSTERLSAADEVDPATGLPKIDEERSDSQLMGLRRSQSSYSLADRPNLASDSEVSQPADSLHTPTESAPTTVSNVSTARHDSIASSATGKSAQLRISTTNLPAVNSRAQGRASMTSDALMATPTVPSIHDFDLLKPISKGAYGSVYLAKKRSTGAYYAIKILKKADMIAKNQISNVKAERAIMMAQTGSPFVVRLLYTFQSRTNLYLVMEYLNGGDCAALLKAIGALPEEWARPYLAEVVLGIEDLHARNVVHRDLKPDNLLIDSEGHLKLTDFGLSKLGFLGRRVGQQPIPHPMGSSELAQGGPLQFQLPASPTPLAKPVSPPIRRDASYRDSAIDGMGSLAGSPQVAANKRVSALKEDFSPQSPFSLKQGSATSSSSASVSSGTDDDASGVTPGSKKRKHALGTPDYIAPESILGLESGESVDWWALGVICYEFLFGIPPFHDETPEKVFQNILSRDVDFFDDEREMQRRQQEERRRLRAISSGSDEDEDEDEDTGIPEISPDARDFISRLLCKDPKRRLGHNGAAEVKRHPIFRDINWSTLLNTQPAFVPQVEGIEDTEYFDSRGATMEHHEQQSDNSQDGHRADTDSSQSVSASSDEDVGPLSKSHEEDSLASVLGKGIAIHRPKTLPVRLNELAQDSAADRHDVAAETPTRKPARRGSRSRLRGKGLPRLEEDPEFGGFTFKNLHVLEEANMNELVKLRRRSTLIGVRPPVSAGLDARGSLSQGLTPDSLVAPQAQRHRSHMGGSTTSSASLSLDLSPAFQASFGAQQPHGFSLGAPLTRTATLPLLSAELHSGNIDSASGSSRSPGLTVQTRPPLPQGGHKRALSAHSQRGSLLNPNVQTPQSARSSEVGHVSDALSFAADGQQDSATARDSLSLLTPLQAPPAFRKSVTVGALQRPVTPAQTGSAEHVAEIDSHEHLQSKVCLVADDNPVFCKVMEIILERMHMECVIVRNGAEAIRCAMGQTVYRAIFMDTGMPIVDGDEATRMIKSTYNSNKNTPIVAMAAYEDEVNDALYDKVLVKPVTAHQIRQLLSGEL